MDLTPLLAMYALIRNRNVTPSKPKVLDDHHDDEGSFEQRVINWADATKALRTGDNGSKLPHTPDAPTSREFSHSTTTDTITKVLPELSWRGTLGTPPSDFKN